MLTRNASPALRAWKYGLALPVLTLIFLFTRQTPALAQKENDKAQKGDVKELTEVEQAPQFPGGQEALLKFLATNIQYPEAARRDSAQGVVAIVFVVDENGAVTSVGTPEGVAPGKWRQDLVDEAVRVVKLMPAWQPAISKGKPVKVKFTLPIKFKLQ